MRMKSNSAAPLLGNLAGYSEAGWSKRGSLLVPRSSTSRPTSPTTSSAPSVGWSSRTQRRSSERPLRDVIVTNMAKAGLSRRQRRKRMHWLNGLLQSIASTAGSESE